MTKDDASFWGGQGDKIGKGLGLTKSDKPRRPLAPGYIHVPEDPALPIQLIASYSKEADTYYFPTRYRCPRTESAVEDRLLGPVGTIYSWTFVHLSSMGRVKYADGNGYGVAQVDFPEGPRVQGVLYGAMGEWEIGMQVRVVLHPIDVAEDGTELCGYAFELVGGAIDG